MTVTSWRIVKARFAEGAFDGEGARRFGGRWTSPGVRVVYTAGSAALALLEVLVHADASVLPAYVLIPAEFDESLVSAVDPAGLPSDWRSFPAPPRLRRIGDEWTRAEASAVLRVPSAIVPQEWNYLINPAHPGSGSLTVGTPSPFRVDARLRRSQE